MKIKIGFTGTQSGMTPDQKEKFIGMIITLKPDEFHHGDCIGSDEEAHDIVREIAPNCTIVIHPPTESKKRAFKKGDITLEPRPYLTRNKRIVDLTSYLIGTPGTEQQVVRSGTWSTIRYAFILVQRGVKKGTTPFVILPSGQFWT